MIQYGTIEEEGQKCREAFRVVPDVKIAWLCHHDAIIDPLIHPAEDRMYDILLNKPKIEQAMRFHWFRPVTVALPPIIEQQALAVITQIEAFRAAKRRTSEITEGVEYNAALEAYKEVLGRRSATVEEIMCANNTFSKAQELRKIADAEVQKQCDLYQKVFEEMSGIIKHSNKILMGIHAGLFPGCPFNGETLFPEKVESTDWP